MTKFCRKFSKMELPIEILLKIFSFIEGEDLLQIVLKDLESKGCFSSLTEEDSIWKFHLEKTFPNFSVKFQLPYSKLKLQFPKRNFTGSCFDRFLFLTIYSQDIICGRLPSGNRIFIYQNSFQVEIPNKCHNLLLRGEGKDLVLNGTFGTDFLSPFSITSNRKISILGQIHSTKLKFECKIQKGDIFWFAFVLPELYLVKEFDSERFFFWNSCRLFRHQVYKILENLFCLNEVSRFETHLLEECSRAFTSIYWEIIEKIKSISERRACQRRFSNSEG